MRETFVVMALVFPSNHHPCWGPAFQKRLNICLPTGSGEWIPPFGLLERTVLLRFTSPIKLLPWYISFPAFAFPVLSLPSCCGCMSQRLCGCFAASWGRPTSPHLGKPNAKSHCGMQRMVLCHSTSIHHNASNSNNCYLAHLSLCFQKHQAGMEKGCSGILPSLQLF